MGKFERFNEPGPRQDGIGPTVTRASLQWLWLAVAAMMLGLCGCPEALAQTWPTRFMRITEQQGLPQPPITSFLQDSQGFMWIGSDEGLLRYDGYSHILYAHDYQDPWSICHNQVSSLAQDSDGNIWAASRNGGVSRLDPRSGRFTCFSPFEQDARSRMGREIFAVFSDSAGRVWIGGTPAIGVGVFDPEQGRFLRVELPDVTLTGVMPQSRSSEEPISGVDQPRPDVGSIWDFHELEDGTLLAATDYGMLLLDPRNMHATFHQFDLTERRVTAVTQDETGAVWACGLEGVYAFDPATGTHVLYRPGQPLMATDMILARDGMLWITSEANGIHVFDPHAKQFLTPDPQEGSAGWIGGAANTLFQDASGLTWIGTMRGVVVSSPLLDRFNYVHVYPDTPNHEERPLILEALTCDASGNVWVAAEGSLHRWRPRDNAWCSVPVVNDQGRRPAVKAFSLAATGSETIWLGSSLVLAVDPNLGVKASYPLPRPRQLHPQYTIMDMIPDPDHGLWVGARHGGLFLLNPDTGQILGSWNVEIRQTHQGNIEVNSVMNPWVTALMLDSKGRLYVGYEEGGFSIFDPDSGRFVHHPTQGINVAEAVTAFLEGPEGEVWIATHMGLTRYNPETQALETFTRHNGLPGDSIRSMEMDRNGRLWLGTNAGLARFNPTDGSIQVFDTRDGLGENEFQRGSCTTADGTMYFLGFQGVTSVAPDRFQGRDQSPLPVLTGVLLFNEPVAPGPDSILATMPSYAENVVLEPGMDVVGFEFAALNYLGAETNRFQYRLEGFEEQWNEVGADRRYATYTDLPPGRYVFRVRAASGNSPWSEQEVSLQVTVLPEWWETLFFRFGIILGLAGGSYGVVRLRIRSLERQRRLLRLQVAERTSELADANAKLENLAKVDGLTQVANRRRLDSFLDREWRRLARERRPMGLILLDIDYFKRYNDVYGHLQGDECLRTVARAIDESVQRPMDLVARFGGEEFAVVMPDTDAQGAGFVAEKIRQQIEALGIEHKASDVAAHVSVSLGVAAMTPATGIASEALLQEADKALYQAKLQGRNQVVVHSQAT